MDGGAWWATVHGVAKSRTRLNDFTSLHFTSLHFFSEMERNLISDLTFQKEQRRNRRLGLISGSAAMLWEGMERELGL